MDDGTAEIEKVDPAICEDVEADGRGGVGEIHSGGDSQAGQGRDVLAEFDVISYIGEINASGYQKIHAIVRRQGRRKSVYCILTTHGGNPDAAYKIARCLQQAYDKFILFVPFYCKSAGTLIALGAGELVLGEDAELGPLDAQVRTREELFEFGSSLNPLSALELLRTQVMQTYRDYLLEIKLGSGLTTKMSAEIAAELALGSFRPIYEQVDPMRLGELWRAVNIAFDYGKRLQHDNLFAGALERLVLGYPSHGFVIDRREAEELFRNVRAPSGHEAPILRLLASVYQDVKIGDTIEVGLLNPPEQPSAEEQANWPDPAAGRGQEDVDAVGTRGRRNEDEPEGDARPADDEASAGVGDGLERQKQARRRARKGNV